MLDFDGVLAPIVPVHNSARMSAHTRRLLSACAERGKVVVISGRSLSDVRSRVGLRSVWYAGNHGAEWKMGKIGGRTRLTRAVRANIRAALDECAKLSQMYSGVLVEDKKLTFSVHFRSLAPARQKIFRAHVRRVAKRFEGLLDFEEGSEFIINVRSHVGRTKGDAVLLARGYAREGLIPIYIGDDTTDEDAFRALPRGITIRVGKSRGSAARFFVRARADVDAILAMLARS